MKNFDRFKVVGGEPVNLKKFETNYDDDIKDRDLKKMTQTVWQELAQLQEQLYAESKQSVLIVLQAI